MKLNKLLLPLIVATCNVASSVHAQTADDYVAWGRSHLAGENVSAAHAAFSTALALDPRNETAAALHAVTRILSLPNQPAVSAFLDRLGVESAGRNIYSWTALLPIDKEGLPVVPTGLNATEFAELLRTRMLPALVGAEMDLGRITNAAFRLDLSAAETKTVAVTVDFADIQLIRAALHGLQYLIYVTYDWNLAAQLDVVRSLYATGDLTIQRLLTDYPHLLTFASTNDLNAARTAFENAADRYTLASDLIRKRPPTQIRLFNLEPASETTEELFRKSLLELRASFDQAVPLSIETNYSVFLRALPNPAIPPRALLPTFVGNSFVLGSQPDPTFGGLVGGVTRDQVDSILSRALDGIPSLGEPSYTAGTFECTLRVPAGRVYMVQGSLDLVHWIDLYPVAALDGVIRISDPSASNRGRYYRIVERSENLPVPANDYFQDRAVLTGAYPTTSGYVNPSSHELGEPEEGPTIWFSWTPQTSEQIVIAIEGWPWARIYTGENVNALQFVAYSFEPFSAISGATYQIQVFGWDSDDPGVFKLTVAAPPKLSVSSPADGLVLPEGTEFIVSASVTSPVGIAELCVRIDDNPEICTAGSQLSINTNLPAGDHWITVWAEDAAGFESESNLVVRIAPSNDDYASRQSILGNSAIVNASNTGAGKEPGEPNHAGLAGGASVWWSWTAPSNGPVNIKALFFEEYWYFDSYDGWFYIDYYTYGNPLLAVYTGNFFEPVASAVNSNGNPAQVSFNAVAGTTYHIAVDDRHAGTGKIRLEIDGFKPANDNFANRIGLAGAATSAVGCSFDASSEPSEPDHGGNARSLWWSWTAPTTGPVVISATLGNGYFNFGYPILSVYTGNSLASLQTIANGVAKVESYPAMVSFHATAGVTYQIAIDELYGDTGRVTLRIGPEEETVFPIGSRKSNLAAPPGTLSYYRVTVPPNTSLLQIYTYGGWGDCDLYIRHGSQPTFNLWDYRPFLEGNNEAVQISHPAAGDWHILLHSYGGYAELSLIVR